MYSTVGGQRKSPLHHEPEMVVYARTNAHLKQTEAAALIGIKPNTLSQIEKGTRNAGPEILARMAAVYNCPLVGLEHKPVQQ